MGIGVLQNKSFADLGSNLFAEIISAIVDHRDERAGRLKEFLTGLRVTK